MSQPSNKIVYIDSFDTNNNNKYHENDDDNNYDDNNDYDDNHDYDDKIVGGTRLQKTIDDTLNDKDDIVSENDYDESDDNESDVPHNNDYEHNKTDNKDVNNTLLQQNLTIRQQQNDDLHDDYDSNDDASSVSTINTDDVLSVDPMYYRLTKFLQTGGGENVADILKNMSNQLTTLNLNIESMLQEKTRN